MAVGAKQAKRSHKTRCRRKKRRAPGSGGLWKLMMENNSTINVGGASLPLEEGGNIAGSRGVQEGDFAYPPPILRDASLGPGIEPNHANPEGGSGNRATSGATLGSQTITGDESTERPPPINSVPDLSQSAVIEQLIKQVAEMKKEMSELRSSLKREKEQTQKVQKMETRTKRKYLPHETNERVNISYPKHFIIQSEIKRQLCPYQIRRTLKAELGGPPVNISSGPRDSLVISVTTKEQSERMTTITEIGDAPCSVTGNKIMNRCKATINIYEFDILDLDSFSKGLKEDYNISEVVEATWIKSHNEQRKTFLLTFSQADPPETIQIPGEQTATRVTRYYDRPRHCQACLRYGHPKKYCKSEIISCAKCGQNGHGKAQCKSIKSECFHCMGEHAVGDRRCIEEKYQQEIIIIQNRERISKLSAIQRAKIIYPDRRLTYARVAAATTRVTRKPPSSQQGEERRNDGGSEGRIRERGGGRGGRGWMTARGGRGATSSDVSRGERRMDEAEDQRKGGRTTENNNGLDLSVVNGRFSALQDMDVDDQTDFHLPREMFQNVTGSRITPLTLPKSNEPLVGKTATSKREKENKRSELQQTGRKRLTSGNDPEKLGKLPKLSDEQPVPTTATNQGNNPDAAISTLSTTPVMPSDHNDRGREQTASKPEENWDRDKETDNADITEVISRQEDNVSK